MTLVADDRVVVWFSAGAASAVAAKLAIAAEPERTVVAYIDPGTEHPDNVRFVAECEEWFDRPVERLRSARYADTWEVFEAERSLGANQSAPCTIELKKKVRERYQLPTDLHVFGYTAEEYHRADSFRDHNPAVQLWCPLITGSVTKADCLNLVRRAGIELPTMYKLGYHNNNCIGCVKGGIGYWNMIRIDFPETFNRMARLERRLGRSLLRHRGGLEKGEPMYLDELDPTLGNFAVDQPSECGISCASAEAQWVEVTVS